MMAGVGVGVNVMMGMTLIGVIRMMMGVMCTTVVATVGVLEGGSGVRVGGGGVYVWVGGSGVYVGGRGVCVGGRGVNVSATAG